MDLREFRDEGYLQEVNRQFFHPLGLRLGIAQSGTNGDSGQLWLGDDRDDPEGVRFEGVDLAPKAENVERLKAARLGPRVDALGYWVQPV